MAYFCDMKKIFRIIKRWRYSRLYRKLFMHYAGKFNYAYEATTQADEAFLLLTGEERENWI